MDLITLLELRHGLFLSFRLGSKLTVLDVLEIPPVVYVQSQKVVDPVINALEKESKKVFEIVDAEFRKLKVNYESVLVKGNHVASIIIEYADKHDVNI
jgi:nucleotide-binding universal stress UspA family protein